MLMKIWESLLAGMSAIGDGLGRIWQSFPLVSFDSGYVKRRRLRSDFRSQQSDRDALASDWRQVASDLQHALDRTGSRRETRMK
jgi:hypothetical protein